MTWRGEQGGARSKRGSGLPRPPPLPRGQMEAKGGGASAAAGTAGQPRAAAKPEDEARGGDRDRGGEVGGAPLGGTFALHAFGTTCALPPFAFSAFSVGKPTCVCLCARMSGDLTSMCGVDFRHMVVCLIIVGSPTSWPLVTLATQLLVVAVRVGYHLFVVQCGAFYACVW
jgi:hypothetical protein